MRAITESCEINASAARIFSIYEDVEHWPDWDPDLEAASLTGPFEAGGIGWIKPAGAPRMKTRIVSLAPRQSFTAHARLPLCRMEFIHTIEPVRQGTDSPMAVTHSIDFHGLLALAFRMMLRRKIANSLPRALQGLRRHAEAGSGCTTSGPTTRPEA